MPDKGRESLTDILNHLSATLLPETFHFISIDHEQMQLVDIKNTFATVNETEGLTVIVEAKYKDDFPNQDAAEFSCITLAVHSSLEAVGLTATFSSALAKANISCNVIAGYYHDHIFVQKAKAREALAVIEALKNR